MTLNEPEGNIDTVNLLARLLAALDRSKVGLDDMLTAEQAVQWLQLKSERALLERVRRGDIPCERLGHNTIRFWPRRILLNGGANPRILLDPQRPGQRA